MTHPLRVRGLKQLSLKNFNNISSTHPLRGVRIETHPEQPRDPNDETHPLRGARIETSEVFLIAHISHRRTLCGVRGLKRTWSLTVLSRYRTHPLRGARIAILAASKYAESSSATCALGAQKNEGHPDVITFAFLLWITFFTCCITLF